MKKATKKEEKKESQKNSAVNMGEGEFVDVLIELVSTKAWEAIRKYNRRVDAEHLTYLTSIETFKDPTLMARVQCLRAGLYSLENFVYEEIKKRQDEEKKLNKTPGQTVENLEDQIPSYGA